MLQNYGSDTSYKIALLHRITLGIKDNKYQCCIQPAAESARAYYDSDIVIRESFLSREKWAAEGNSMLWCSSSTTVTPDNVEDGR